MKKMLSYFLILLAIFSIRAASNPINQFFHLLGKVPPYGFFVLTSTTYTGDFGGLAGANAACLTELQNGSWKGKGLVPIDASTVKAFLCDGSSCQDPWPGYYKAAEVGSTTVGGGIITIDANGIGFYDSNDWRTNSYFGSVTDSYWSGRDKYSQLEYSQLYEDNKYPASSATSHCSGWTTTVGNGMYASTYVLNTWDGSNRFSNSSTACTTGYKLMCIVKPSDVWDTTPDSLGLVNVTNGEKSTQYTASAIVTGINTPVYAIITNNNLYSASSWSAEIQNVTTASGWTNRVLVNLGDQIEVRSTSFPSFDSTKSIELSVGGLMTNWQITTRPANPEVNVGFLVSSDNVYNGNLGGLVGANSICLDEANNRWTNKGRVKVSSANVKAFLCDSSTCNNLTANKKYYFDRFGLYSGASTSSLGGAFIYSDASGLGPNTTGMWYDSGTTVSGYMFSWGTPWTGRGTGAASLWPNSPSLNHCNNWTDGTSGFSGTTGDSQGTSTTRWSTTADTCNLSNQIFCMVHPPANGFGFDDVLGASANTIYTKTHTFSGLTSAISASVISGSAEIRKNAGAWGTSIATLNNGDVIDIRMTSSVLKNGARVSVVQAGDATVEWVIRNKDAVSDEQAFARGSATQYRWSISGSGSTVVLVNGTTNLYVYSKSGATWSLSETVALGFTPESVAIDGNVLVLGDRDYGGMYANGGPFSSAGRIVVIEKAATWAAGTQTQILPSVGSAWLYFGHGVAIRSNLIVVGAEGSGVYFYQNTGGGWAAATETIRATTATYPGPNGNVAIRGNTVVVGTAQVNTPGQINIFEDSGGGWATASLTSFSASDGSINDYFGMSLDLSADENTIVVGASQKLVTMDTSTFASEHGKVYVYEKGASWASKTETILLPPTTQPYASFGSSLKIQGNIIAVGAYRGFSEGTVYLFKKGTSWTNSSIDLILKRTVSPALSGPYDYFGRWLFLCGDSIAATASKTPINSPSGYLYFYDISGLTGGGATCN